MKFNVHERVMLMNALSEVQGNLATLRVVRDLQQEVSFTDDEIQTIGLREDGGMMRWNQHDLPAKAVNLGLSALEAALTSFKRRDEEGRLSMELLPLYERLLAEHETLRKAWLLKERERIEKGEPAKLQAVEEKSA